MQKTPEIYSAGSISRIYRRVRAVGGMGVLSVGLGWAWIVEGKGCACGLGNSLR
jgi:hypothetical protein